MRLKTIRLKKSQSKIPTEILYEDFTHLEIFGGLLEEIPGEIFCKEGVEVIKIKNTGLSALPESLPKMANPKLKSLSLPQNQLSTIPDWLSQFVKLETLDLGANQICEISEFLPPNLLRINLELNKLNSLPEQLYRLKGLLHLNVESNPLNEETLNRIYETYGIWID